jgi:hypothetical protein
LDLPKELKPYVTTDFSLAITMWVLALKLVNRDGQPPKPKECPEYREINAKELDELGIDFAEGMKRGLGQIAYGFAYHENRQKIIDTFNKARKAAKEGANQEIPDTFEIKCECGREHTQDLVEILATFAGYLFAARKHFADRRPRVGALLRVPKGTGFELIDPRTIQ